MFDTPLTVISPKEPVNVPVPAAQAEVVPPAEQPANDNETMRSAAAAVLTARQRLLPRCTAMAFFAQRLSRSFLHFLTRSRSSVILPTK